MMKFPYINKDGNRAETEDLALVPSFIQKIDGVYFEKKVEVKVEKKVEVKAEIKEDLFDRAKEFCKENKIKSYGLLRGQKMIDKAIENGFII